MKYLCICFIVFLANCSTALFREKPGTPEYWKFSERVFIDFYGSESKREDAFSALEKKCNSTSKLEALSCYNLSVLYFYSKKINESYKFAKKAVLKNPKDELYLDMLRQAAIELQDTEALQNDYPGEENEIASSFTKLSIYCKNNNEKSALLEFEFLISRGYITKEILHSPQYENCLSKDSLKMISHNVKNAKINYKNFFLKEKKDSHEFSPVWDTVSYLDTTQPNLREPPKKNLTKHWLNFRKSISSEDYTTAKETLKLFFEEIQNGLVKDKKHKHLYHSINKAARLLIEQDKFFEKFKNLTKEL
ncbi:MAG: hypothetical protein L6Q54_11905 [Leptospiraceae bacterium]|nr:hypothetical protein [Leptospiraceae bacterium]MCK6381934.1 hypothetical protein [Leptospiraceae bacterium]NUM42281.1 hypothetical protein [Leptospiraceae bacterium]